MTVRSWTPAFNCFAIELLTGYPMIETTYTRVLADSWLAIRSFDRYGNIFLLCFKIDILLYTNVKDNRIAKIYRVQVVSMSLAKNPADTLRLFYSYTHKDEPWLKKLETHLSNLRRQGFISSWHGCNITAGTDWRSESLTRLNEAHLILLLVSPDFLASEYCQSVEMAAAVKRHEMGDVRVIPIILRPCDWKGTFIEKLQVLPTSGKAVTLWNNRDNALLQITQGIRTVVEELVLSSSILARYDEDQNPREPDDATYRQSVKHQILSQRYQDERRKQEGDASPSHKYTKIDKDIIVNYDLTTQMEKFSRRLNFGGTYAFILEGQYNVLRDYIIERMCQEMKHKMGRRHRKIDISLLREDMTEDMGYLLRKKVMTRNHCSTLTDLFREDTDSDIILTIWNHFFPSKIIKGILQSFWEDITTNISPFLERSDQCFVVILANVGEKSAIDQIDQFVPLPIPERFEIPDLTRWIRGNLRRQGVQHPDIEQCIQRLQENHGHFLPTYQEIENIINDLQGRCKGL